MFLFFRLVIFLLSLVVAILSAFALAGSYSVASYLTPAYLIDFHLDKLNLALLFGLTTESKREAFLNVVQREEDISDREPTRVVRLVDVEERDTPTTTFGNSYLSSFISVKAGADGLLSSVTFAVYGTNVATQSLVTSVYTVSPENPNSANDYNPATANSLATSVYTISTMYAVATSTYAVASNAMQTGTKTSSDSSQTSLSASAGEVKQAVQQLLSAKGIGYSQLGLADVYSVSFWGYCRGLSTSDANGKVFDNGKVKWTYCSKSQAGYAFDPIKIIKHEMLNSLNGNVDGDVTRSDTVFLSQYDDTTKSNALTVINGLTYENLNLPGSLEKNIKKVNNINKASFALILLVCLCGCISALIQLIGMFLSPESFLLSLLNYGFQCLIFVFAIISAALVTGIYIFVRSQVNDNTEIWGIKSFLSINFYAYIWAAVAASFLIVVNSFLGHCLGLFGTGRKRYRRVKTAKSDAIEEAVEEALEKDHEHHGH